MITYTAHNFFVCGVYGLCWPKTSGSWWCCHSTSWRETFDGSWVCQLIQLRELVACQLIIWACIFRSCLVCCLIYLGSDQMYSANSLLYQICFYLVSCSSLLPVLNLRILVFSSGYCKLVQVISVQIKFHKVKIFRFSFSSNCYHHNPSSKTRRRKKGRMHLPVSTCP